MRLMGWKGADVDVETTDSVGLPGRSVSDGEEGGMDPWGIFVTAGGEVEERDSRLRWGTLSEEADPLIVASLRRRSSKGAPDGLSIV